MHSNGVAYHVIKRWTGGGGGGVFKNEGTWVCAHCLPDNEIIEAFRVIFIDKGAIWFSKIQKISILPIAFSLNCWHFQWRSRWMCAWSKKWKFSPRARPLLLFPLFPFLVSFFLFSFFFVVSAPPWAGARGVYFPLPPYLHQWTFFEVLEIKKVKMLGVIGWTSYWRNKVAPKVAYRQADDTGQHMGPPACYLIS